MTDRIKQLRVKNLQNNFDSIPFGANGNFIDMFSGLDLEEELKLGGNHYTEIDNTTDLKITEYYLDKPKEEESIINEASHVCYKVVTIFISSDLYWEADSSNMLVVGPLSDDFEATDSYDPNIINEDFIILTSSQQEEVKTVGQFKSILFKNLNFKQDNSTFQWSAIHQKDVIIQLNGTQYKINESQSIPEGEELSQIMNKYSAEDSI